MTGILDSHGMPCFVLARRVRMSPPSTSVWLSRRTTDVSASRLMMSGREARGPGVADVVDGLLHVEGDHPLVADAGRDGQDDAGVAVLDALGEDVPEDDPGLCAAAAAGPSDVDDLLLVTMGTEFDTLMTAFLFSEVMIVGLESTVSWP